MNTKPTRKIIRLPEWDYRTPTYYFVTICTHNRQNLFSDDLFYDIAAQAWAYIPQQPHANQFVLDEWVVMPNHLHGIILLTQEPTPLNEKRPIPPKTSTLSSAR
ncbi:MAG: transposase [Candidatus Omnitrophica bacterium]|nr:transposase [Candidatus Omnitrophota bacterium]